MARATGTLGALFLLSNVDVLEKLSLLGGIRLDHYTPDFTGRFNGEPDARRDQFRHGGDLQRQRHLFKAGRPGCIPYFT